MCAGEFVTWLDSTDAAPPKTVGRFITVSRTTAVKVGLMSLGIVCKKTQPSLTLFPGCFEMRK